MPQRDDELESLFTRALNRPETLSESERRRILDAVVVGTELNVVHTLSSLAEHDQEVIDEIVDRLKPQLRADDDRSRGEAAHVFATLARRYPEQLTPVATEAVALLSDDFPAARNRGAQLLARLAGVDPDLAVPAASHVRPFVRSKAPILRLSGLEIVHAIAQTEPERVRELATALVDVVVEPTERSDNEQIEEWIEGAPRRRDVRTVRRNDNTEWPRELARARAAQTLAILAPECPAALSESTPQLATVIERDDHPIVIGALADAVAALSRERTEAGYEAIGPLGAALDRFDDEETVARVALALSILADRHRETVTESVQSILPIVIDLLEAEQSIVRGAATSLLVVVSEHRPDTVKPSLGAIHELLDDRNPVVRGGAAWVLGAAGLPEDRDRLVGLCEDDPDADVRKAADQALREIEERYDTSSSNQT